MRAKRSLRTDVAATRFASRSARGGFFDIDCCATRNPDRRGDCVLKTVIDLRSEWLDVGRIELLLAAT